MLAHHLIFAPYGRWLPNAPRGSWSHFVGSWELFLAAGPTTKNTAPTDNPPLRTAATHALLHPPVFFSNKQITTIATAFAARIQKSHYICLACALLPDHIHLLLTTHTVTPRQQVRALKQQATEALTAARLHPATHTPWAKNCWDHYLDAPTDIRRAITYIENNPTKSNLPPQSWPFVTPYPLPPNPPSRSPQEGSRR